LFQQAVLVGEFKSEHRQPRIVSRAAGDVHRRGASEIERRGRARTVRRDFQMVGAAEERDHFSDRRVGVGRHDFRDLMRADANLERGAGELVERLAIDVRDQIPESIDAQDFAGDGLGIDGRPRQIEAVDRAGRSPSAVRSPCEPRGSEANRPRPRRCGSRSAARSAARSARRLSWSRSSMTAVSTPLSGATNL
jgi:hypothetical protein